MATSTQHASGHARRDIELLDVTVSQSSAVGPTEQPEQLSDSGSTRSRPTGMIQVIYTSVFGKDAAFSHEVDELSRTRPIVYMTTIVLLPTLALLRLMAVSLHLALEVDRRNVLARRTLEETAVLARVIAALQLERGFSAAFITGDRHDGELVRALLGAQREVDDHVTQVDPWLKVVVMGDETAKTALEFSRYLTAHRTRMFVFADDIDYHETIRFYTNITHGLIDVIDKHVILPPQRRFWGTFIGFISVLLRADSLDIERALGSVYLLECRLDEADRKWFVREQAGADEFRVMLGMYYPPGIDALRREERRGAGFLDNLDQLTAEVSDPSAKGSCAQLPPAQRTQHRKEWFWNITEYIQLHYEIANSIIDVIHDDLDALVLQAEMEVNAYSVSITAIFIFFSTAGVWYGLRIHKVTQKIQAMARFIRDKVDELTLERSRTERLLYQILPRAVADQLRAGTPVKPESYDSATVYFSHIVGFQEIGRANTPHQVLNILNALYRLFDEVIDNYDVYKVETIGDCCLVVSGVPERNGDEHVTQIALLALELRAGVTSFVTPNDTSAQLQLRVGIHTGPVVAGVVGTKMPRYCLFGDTVNTASRMETTGRPMEIQMSYATADVLNKCDGFSFKLRGSIHVKGKGQMRTYWLRNHSKFS